MGMIWRWISGCLNEMSFKLSFSFLARSSSSGCLITPKEQSTQNIFLLKNNYTFRRHRYYWHCHNYFSHYHWHNFQSSSWRISLPTQWKNKKKLADSILFITCTFKIKLWPNSLEHECVKQTEKLLFTAWNSAFSLESALEIVVLLLS